MNKAAVRTPARRVRQKRTTEHRTPRKEEILDVAAELFGEHGFEAVSLADIAAAVGLSKTTLYHYFERKEQILGTLIVATIRQLNEFVAANVPAQAAADQKLIAFVVAQAEFFERHRTQFKVLLTQFGRLTDPAARDQAVEWRVQYENAIRRIIQEGVASGLFSGQRPNAVVRAVLASVYWLVRWYRPDGQASARDIAREYAQLLLYGIVVREDVSAADARPAV
jgi:AcrR family transcriptional regulator